MLPTGTRRRLPQGGTTHTSYVDLWPAHRDGDLLQGFVRVPLALVGAKEHSKERAEFMKIIQANLKAWVEWKGKQGWRMTTTPQVAGPFDPPTERQGGSLIDAAYPPHKRYVITARFTRDTPQWIPADAAKWINDQADMYGVDMRDSSELKDTGVNETADVILDDGTPPHDPMKYAEERRQMLGLKREDFIID